MSKSDKKVNCKACGAEISSDAAICPACGRKVKKPIFKKWWFWLIVAVVVISALTGGDDSADTSSQDNVSAPATETVKNDNTEAVKNDNKKVEPEIEYIVCDVTELFDALNNNALKAEETYKDKYVEVTGHLGTIDSSGKYLALCADENNYDYIFQDIQCNIKSDEQRNQVMELSKNDTITIKGKITVVGEVLGYTLNIDSIS